MVERSSGEGLSSFDPVDPRPHRDGFLNRSEGPIPNVEGAREASDIVQNADRPQQFVENPGDHAAVHPTRWAVGDRVEAMLGSKFVLSQAGEQYVYAETRWSDADELGKSLFPGNHAVVFESGLRTERWQISGMPFEDVWFDGADVTSTGVNGAAAAIKHKCPLGQSSCNRVLYTHASIPAEFFQSRGLKHHEAKGHMLARPFTKTTSAMAPIQPRF